MEAKIIRDKNQVLCEEKQNYTILANLLSPFSYYRMKGMTNSNLNNQVVENVILTFMKWRQNDKVGSLQIAIQSCKLLHDTSNAVLYKL